MHSPARRRMCTGCGASLFTALTGHAAFERRQGENVVAQFARITSQPIPDLRQQGIPADFATLIERAMAREPHASSALEFGRQIQELQNAARAGRRQDGPECR